MVRNVRNFIFSIGILGGALLKYLKDHGSKCSPRDLIHMCKDAANGMEYLAEQNCIHRYGFCLP